MLKKNHYYLFFFLIFAIVFILSRNLILLDPVLGYDDWLLLAPLYKINSVFEYSDFILKGMIFDIQPVRDISFFFDIYLKNYIHHSFHLTNLFLWFGIVFLFLKIFSTFECKKLTALQLSFAFFIAVSPVFASSFFWISARKHLLSALFILICTYLVLNEDNEIKTKNVFIVLVFYSLSVLSQPINILWPLWAFVYLRLKNKLSGHKIFLGCLIFLMLLFLAGNFYYYNSIFINVTGGIDKYDPDAVGSLGLPLLAIGRYFYLAIFPFDALPSPHYQGSLQNLLGLSLASIFFFALYKKTNRLIFYCCLTYFLFHLAPVTIKITRIFCSDTYLLNASLGIYAGVFFLFRRLRWFQIFLFFYSVALTIQLFSYEKVFHSSLNLWEYSYNKEASPDSTLFLAQAYVKSGKHKEAELLIQRAKEWDPFNLNLLSTAIDNVYFNKKLDSAEKISRLKKITPMSSLGAYYLAFLFANQNDRSNFLSYIKTSFSLTTGFARTVGRQGEIFTAAFDVTCERLLITVECRPLYKTLRENLHYPNWNKSLYLKYRDHFTKMGKNIQF